MTEYPTLEGTKRISPTEEAALIEDASTNPAAFNRLYLSYIHPIYRYIFSKVTDKKDAEDLTAQVFLDALEGLPRYRHDGHFAAWLFGIARHKIADHYRSSRSEVPLNISVPDAGSMNNPLSHVIRTEDSQRMARLIGKLSEHEQELLRLRFMAELDFGEIAYLIHKNVDTTKKRVYRLLARLRQQMDHDHE